MERASDAGRAVLTSQLAFAQDVGASSPLGFLIYLPVYHGDVAPQTVAQRRDQRMGFVYTAFRAADIGRSVPQANSSDIALQLFEGGDNGPLLYEATRSDVDC